MPERFIFRQVDYRDIPTFLTDGEIRSHNHHSMQKCIQTSDPTIKHRRDSDIYKMPNGCSVNDYVAFYFSPFTSFVCLIHRGGVPVFGPNGEDLGESKLSDRVFIVCKVSEVFSSDHDCCYSNAALNSYAPIPEVLNDPNRLEEHVDWELFDENYITASVSEIGYAGVCKFFSFKATPARYQNRKHLRMAEFLVHNSLSLHQVTCIIVPNDAKRELIQTHVNASDWGIPVYSKPECFVK